jgi:Notch-like protein
MRASEIQLFANPQDAQSYLICTDVEVFISMPCSPGTTFNAQARHCLPANYEQPKCPENFCMNNADCDLNENSEPICMCRVGFTGQRCEVNIDECEVLGGNSVCSVNSK